MRPHPIRLPAPPRLRPLLAATIGTALGLSACSVDTITGSLPNAAGAAKRMDGSLGEASGDFTAFAQALWPDARARGVSRATFEAAFRGLTPDPKVVALTRKQSEFVRPIWDYVGSAISQARLERGAQMRARWASVLDEVERRYGVPRSAILGVWGMETNFGSFTGSMDVIRSLATLAQIRYRDDYFRDELLVALQILEADHIDRSAMTGSWAGAMGQTQFMPTSFMKFAVDGDGDGRRDIWTSVPDALASTANFLRQHGWKPGLPWGYEVVLPSGLDLRRDTASLGAWAGLGVRRADGGPLAGGGEARLFLPAGIRGPAFLVTDNFKVIKDYNASDAYALGVAHLGDRLMGGLAIRGRWPTDEPQLSGDERREVQTHLTRLGLYAGTQDGKLGSMTREAVKRFQVNRGLPADGYADASVLGALRQAAR